MSADLPQSVREALADLAEPPPVNLAETIIHRARRRQRARFAVGGIAGVVAAAIAVTALPHGPSSTGYSPAANATTAARPENAPKMLVTSYSGIASPTDPSWAAMTSLVLDPVSGTYDSLPYPGAVPSPDGRRALVHEGDNSAAHPSRAGIWDRATGQVRWIQGHAGSDQDGSWSPDGKRVLLSERPRVGESGFVLVDVDTLQATFVPVPDAADANAASQQFVWAPGGTGVALTISHTVGSDQVVNGIRFYDLSGKPTRNVPATNVLTGGFSTDGRLMALQSQVDDRTIQIASVATGQVEHQITPTGPTNVIGWYDEEHLLVESAGTRAQGTVVLQVLDLTGRVVKSVGLRTFSQHLYAGTPDGLTARVLKQAF